MFKTRLGIIAAAATVLMTTGAAAHSPTSIHRTQAWQMRQIQDGRDSGSLTRREYNALIAEQNRISEMLHRAKRNGIQHHEFRIIKRAQRDAANHINVEITDRQVNYWRRWKTRYAN